MIIILYCGLFGGTKLIKKKRFNKIDAGWCVAEITNKVIWSIIKYITSHTMQIDMSSAMQFGGKFVQSPFFFFLI